MVGQERTVLPLMAHEIFGLTAFTAVLSFVLAFGVTKALSNLVAGALADRCCFGPDRAQGPHRRRHAAPSGVDRVNRRRIDVTVWLLAAALLGLGTAIVYPTLLAAVADVATPSWRGAAVDVYRLWRDLGFAAGAIVAGVLADRAGMPFAIGAIAALTAASGLVVLIRMRETRPG